ncbi:PREDICTED: uncharacterized protein LOC105460069 [Wasmannia auropunctata]|uniref:uncharacterized protein LOC105460069 n=1 Tax=Wasmannia auropunctata TaxID=64793 RepID=UPI0005ED60DD|nr:PREDICTED: uncharacterized protein LOC105460069 [Wasmannia auropunctata]
MYFYFIKLFFSFPKNEDLRLKWYEAIGKKVYRNACICSKHFTIEDYKNHEDPNLIRRLLKASAVPNKVCTKLELVENSSFDNVDILVGNNDESFQFVNCISLEYKNDIIKNEINENTLQIDELSTSTKINPATKRTLNDKAVTFVNVNQIKKRKIRDCLQPVVRQGCQNVSGIVRKEDFRNVNTWLRFQKYINVMRKQYKSLLHKNRRLHLQLSNFKDMLNTLKTK